MRAAPSPVTLTTTASAPWWELVGALGPLAVLLAALVAAYVGWRTLQQRTTADARSEWWRRAQWALELTLMVDPERQLLGFITLDLLARSELARAEELTFLRRALEAVRPLETTVAVESALAPPLPRPDQLRAAVARLSETLERRPIA